MGDSLMRYLLYFEFALLAFCASMGVTMSVVAIMYGAYLDHAPARKSLPAVLAITAVFALFTFLLGFAVRQLYKQSPTWWRWQVAFALSFIPGCWILLRSIGANV